MLVRGRQRAKIHQTPQEIAIEVRGLISRGEYNQFENQVLETSQQSECSLNKDRLIRIKQ